MSAFNLHNNRLWWLVVFIGLWFGSQAPGHAGSFVVYTDRTSFLSALGIASGMDNFSGDPAGPLLNSNLLGRFFYTFDPNRTRPAIAVDALGTNHLGGAPYGVFVGGDQVTLGFNQTNSTLPLTAFGMTLSYAPAAANIPANTYVLTVQGGTASGQSVGNLTLPNSGGTFFLGVIANASVSFNGFALDAIQQDPNTLVPALQVNELIYHSGLMPVPRFTGIVRAGNTITLGGTNGLAGARFYLLSSTNLALPRSQWSVLSTNAFNGSGAFSIFSVYNPTNHQAFFSLLPQ